MNQSRNWPGGVDRSHSNFTGKFPRVSRYDGVGGWAKDSSAPPWGWALSIALGVAVFGLLLFGPSIAAKLF